MNRQEREAAFRERFAEVWRAIGQPDTDDLSVIVWRNTAECEAAGFSVYGMPVLVVEEPIGTLPIAIAFYRRSIGIGDRFRQEWESRGPWHA